MTDTDDYRDTIIPKSDQLNYDDLLAGPITVQITGVKRGSKEQPVIIAIEGYEPYKPCKGMRRVLIAGWGEKGSAWVDRWITLYGEPTVKYGGVEVGGIRISHMSDIAAAVTIKLTISRGKRVEYTVKPLIMDEPQAAPSSRIAKCRAFLDGKGIPVEGAEALIEHELASATVADLKRIAAWAKDQPDEELPFDE